MSRLLRSFRARIERVSGPVSALGRSVLLIGIAAWIVGARWDWNEFFVLAASCLIAVAIAVLFTIGRTQIKVAMVMHPPRVVVGERAVGDFMVTNTSKHRMLPLRLEIPIGRSVGTMDVPSLAAEDTFEETIVIPTSRRSVIAVGPTRSVRGDPLGLMRREITWSDAQEIFVHARTTPLTGLTSGWLRDLDGRPTNDRSPSDVELHTLREYVPGDDRRHVHWRTSARIDKLMVRQFIDNRRSHLAIVIDTNPLGYADADEFELAVSMAASLGRRTIMDGQEASCVAGGRGIPAHNSQALMDGLSRVELGVPAIDIREMAVKVLPLVRSASVIAMMTGSATSLADVQVAGRRIGSDAQVVAVRAALAEQAGVQRSARMISLTADSLESFTRVMWSVGNS